MFPVTPVGVKFDENYNVILQDLYQQVVLCKNPFMDDTHTPHKPKFSRVSGGLEGIIFEANDNQLANWEKVKVPCQLNPLLRAFLPIPYPINNPPPVLVYNGDILKLLKSKYSCFGYSSHQICLAEQLWNSVRVGGNIFTISNIGPVILRLTTKEMLKPRYLSLLGKFHSTQSKRPLILSRVCPQTLINGDKIITDEKDLNQKNTVPLMELIRNYYTEYLTITYEHEKPDYAELEQKLLNGGLNP